MRFSAVCLQALERSARASTSHSTSVSTSRRAKSISFLGLGRMGSEMAFNLFAKRHALSCSNARGQTEIDANEGVRDADRDVMETFVVCDAVPDAAVAFANRSRREFPAADVRIVSSPEEAVHASQTVITMLPSSPHVRAVYTEERGVLSALRSLPAEQARATLCIDSTTLDVNVARQVAAEVIAAGAQMVDAPVSGGVSGAKAGTLSFLVGGSAAGYARASPLLSHMGRKLIYCGPAGSGLVAKICNNLMLGVEQIVTAEAMLLGARLGVDPAVLAEVVNSSTGACWSCAVNNPVPEALVDKSRPCVNDFEGGFATALMIKDMGLATDSASATGTPSLLGAAAQKIYEDAVKSDPGLARKDFSSVYRYLEKKIVTSS